MTSLSALGGYGSGSSDDDSDGGGGGRSPAAGPPSLPEPGVALPAPGARLAATSLATAVVSAPVVELNASLDSRRHLDPAATEVKYNPR